jgi:hypothetical protein
LKALQKVRYWLYRVHFVLETDVNVLVAQLNRSATDLPGALVTRWIVYIRLFDFEVCHVPGNKHTAADGLSQRPCTESDDIDEANEVNIDDFIDAEINAFSVAPVVTDETERTERTERTDEIETDGMKNDDDAVLIQVKDNPEKKQKLRTPRKKYLDIIKENTNPETVFDEVMKQPVMIKLQDLLACSPMFTKLLFKDMTMPKEEISIPSVKIDSIGLCHQHQEKTYAAKTSKLSVKVDGTTTQTMLDTGAEVNIITCSAAEELRLPVQTDLLLALKAVSGDT